MTELYWQRARLVFGAQMSPACKLVLLALSDHLGSNASCYPSVPRLQLRTGYSRMSVLRALAELEQLGAIQITRAHGRSNVYTLDLDWLRANQYHPGTSTTEVPVPQRDGYPYHPGTTPVPQRYPTRTTEVPKGDQEGDQEGDHLKEIKTSPSVNKSQKVTPAKKKTRCLTRQQAAALPIPDGLPAGYADAFTTWCEVRPGSTWRQSPAQIERTHRKLLQAYSEGKDVVQGLERAIESGWKGIKTSWLEELPRTSRPAVKDTDQRIPTWATRRRIQRPEPTPEPSQAETTPAPWEL